MRRLTILAVWFLLAPASFAEDTRNTEDEAIPLVPLTQKTIDGITAFRTRQERLERLKQAPLKNYDYVKRQRSYNEWVLVGQREWGDLHKEALSELKSKVEPVLEKNRATLQSLLIGSISYTIFLSDTPVNEQTLKTYQRVYLNQTTDKVGAYLSVPCLIVLDEAGKYQFFYPDYEQIEPLLTDTLAFVQGPSTGKDGANELAKRGVETTILAPLQTFHKALRRGKVPSIARVVQVHWAKWEELPEQEWGSIHKQVLQNLEQRWNTVFEKSKTDIETLGLARITLRCLQFSNIRDPEKALSFATAEIKNDTLSVDAIVIRTGSTYSFRYPALDEKFTAYIAEQASRAN